MSFYENFPLFACGTIAGYLLYNIVPITSYLFNLMTLNPGTGKVFSRTHPKSKKKGIFVDTNVGRIKLPFIKLPSIDTEIYFFTDENIIEKSELVNRNVFNEKYSFLETEKLKHYEMGIITDVLKPEDFKNKNRICGFVSSLFEDYIYVFTIENNIIDYEKIFEDFDDELTKLDNFATMTIPEAEGVTNKLDKLD